MARRSRFHSDRNELLPLASWPYVPVALYQRYRPPTNQPWFNHRAIRFLDRIITPRTRVLEIGAGGSTSWYAERAERVDAIDGQQEWFEKVSQATAGLPNVSVSFVPEAAIVQHLKGIVGGYDLVVLDTLGADGRVDASCVLRDNHPDAVIGIDDQDWEGHRRIDKVMSGWNVRRFAGMKSDPFRVFETNFFSRLPFSVSYGRAPVWRLPSGME